MGVAGVGATRKWNESSFRCVPVPSSLGVASSMTRVGVQEEGGDMTSTLLPLWNATRSPPPPSTASEGDWPSPAAHVSSWAEQSALRQRMVSRVKWFSASTAMRGNPSTPSAIDRGPIVVGGRSWNVELEQDASRQRVTLVAPPVRLV